jgi:hypothetical protein
MQSSTSLLITLYFPEKHHCLRHLKITNFLPPYKTCPDIKVLKLHWTKLSVCRNFNWESSTYKSYVITDFPLLSEYKFRGWQVYRRDIITRTCNISIPTSVPPSYVDKLRVQWFRIHANFTLFFKRCHSHVLLWLKYDISDPWQFRHHFTSTNFTWH